MADDEWEGDTGGAEEMIPGLRVTEFGSSGDGVTKVVDSGDTPQARLDRQRAEAEDAIRKQPGFGVPAQPPLHLRQDGSGGTQAPYMARAPMTAATSIVEIRMRCLEMAVAAAGEGNHVGIMSLAREYLAFITEGV